MHGLCLCGCTALHHPSAAEQGATARASGGGTIASLVFNGSGLEWRERPRPRIQGPGEAIVRPVAASTCDLDQHIIRGKTPFRGPFAIGHEAVGEVIDIGEDVRSVTIGDIVAIPWHINCGTCDRCKRGLTAHCRAFPEGACYGLPVPGDWGGLFDDLVRVPSADGMLVRVPDGVDPLTVVSASDNLSIGWEVTVEHLAAKPGARVVVVGGVNSIGLYAADFARALGASEVVYCDTSERRLRIAEDLGVTAHAGLPGRELGTFDLSVDASCEPAGLRRALMVLEPEAVCESVGIYFADVPVPTYGMYSRAVRFRTAKGNARHALGPVLQMVAEGKVRPGLVHSAVRPWDTVIAEMGETDKPIFTRPPVSAPGQAA